MVDAVVSDQVVVDNGADYLGRLFDLLFRVLADYLRDSPVLLRTFGGPSVIRAISPTAAGQFDLG